MADENCNTSNKKVRYEPLMVEYLNHLTDLSPDAKGLVSCDARTIRRAIKFGDSLAHNLTGALQCLGPVIEHGTDAERGPDNICISWLVGSIAEFILSIQQIKTQLIACLENKRWPNKVFERSEFTFKTFLTQLPYSCDFSRRGANLPALQNLLDWCRFMDSSQSVGIRVFSCALGYAIASEELETDTICLGNLLVNEWLALTEFMSFASGESDYALSNKEAA